MLAGIVSRHAQSVPAVRRVLLGALLLAPALTVLCCAGPSSQTRTEKPAQCGQSSSETQSGPRQDPSSETHAGRPGARQEGRASYYSPNLAGRRTATGERYDPNKLTAAHPALPLGTQVRVTRTDGARQSVIVRINDRCAGQRKIIEVSQAAARKLDMLRAGLVPVEVEVISRP